MAGSTATMAGVVRHAIAAGLPVPEVAAAASTTPARVLGIDDRAGAICPGLEADLVVCDHAFRLRAVMAGGQWLSGAPKDPQGKASPSLRNAGPYSGGSG
jgi:N-acetylglucosamine-6-phosphate deacetylase